MNLPFHRLIRPLRSGVSTSAIVPQFLSFMLSVVIGRFTTTIYDLLCTSLCKFAYVFNCVHIMMKHYRVFSRGAACYETQSNVLRQNKVVCPPGSQLQLRLYFY